MLLIRYFVLACLLFSPTARDGVNKITDPTSDCTNASLHPLADLSENVPKSGQTRLRGVAKCAKSLRDRALYGFDELIKPRCNSARDTEILVWDDLSHRFINLACEGVQEPQLVGDHANGGALYSCLLGQRVEHEGLRLVRRCVAKLAFEDVGQDRCGDVRLSGK